MGAGIAQLACLSGARTLLHDPVPDALARGAGSACAQTSSAARSAGATSRRGAATPRRGSSPPRELEDLAACELVIEAAPESLELKHELFGALCARSSPSDCVLATNTSSLPVTAIAAGGDAPRARRRACTSSTPRR